MAHFIAECVAEQNGAATPIAIAFKRMFTSAVYNMVSGIEQKRYSADGSPRITSAYWNKVSVLNGSGSSKEESTVAKPGMRPSEVFLGEVNVSIPTEGKGSDQNIDVENEYSKINYWSV